MALLKTLLVSFMVQVADDSTTLGAYFQDLGRTGGTVIGTAPICDGRCGSDCPGRTEDYEERVALRVPVQDAHLAARRRGEGVGVGFPGAGAAEEQRRDREPQRAAARAAAGAVDHGRGEFTLVLAMERTSLFALQALSRC